MQAETATTSVRLRQNKERILEVWEQRARKKVPAAKKESKLYLRDALPLFIDEIAKALETPRKAAACEGSSVCREHGEQRASLEAYTFEEIAEEYRLLCSTLLEVLEADGQLPVEQRDCIFESIFNGIQEAGSAFMRLHVSHERKVVDQLRVERDLREEFVATLSHDLRNPLSAARASAHLIMRYGERQDVRQKATARLTSALERAEDMIADLLDSQRIRAGQKLHLKMTLVELNALLDDMLSELKTIHGDRFVLNVEGGISGYWNEKHLRRALENLINNAIKYGEPGGEITLGVVQREGEVAISVTNTGNPIPPEEQTKIFQPFYRAGSPQNLSQKKGWGLGLLLVKGIAEAHRGRVEVKSSAHDGTTFSIILPTDSRGVPSGT